MVLAVGGHTMAELPVASVRMANGFGGGVGGSHHDLCGALSGGIMVIGGLYGRVDVGQDDRVSQGLSADYRQAFLDRFGVTCCGPLRDRIKAPGGPGSCAVVVEGAAQLMLDLLDRAPCAPRPAFRALDSKGVREGETP
jgi:C_GCAxxG_C_C family probable redox protein